MEERDSKGEKSTEKNWERDWDQERSAAPTNDIKDDVDVSEKD